MSTRNLGLCSHESKIMRNAAAMRTTSFRCEPDYPTGAVASILGRPGPQDVNQWFRRVQNCECVRGLSAKTSSIRNQSHSLDHEALVLLRATSATQGFQIESSK